MGKVCCCTGHRPKGFPFEHGKGEKHIAYLKVLQEKIEFAINELGVTHFISGMALGADTDFAAKVLQLKDNYPITLECALPYQTYNYNLQKEQSLRNDIIYKYADKSFYVSVCYTLGCFHKRDRYMVDKSDFVIAIFNGIEKGGTWYTINYAKSKNKPVILIDLNSL